MSLSGSFFLFLLAYVWGYKFKELSRRGNLFIVKWLKIILCIGSVKCLLLIHFCRLYCIQYWLNLIFYTHCQEAGSSRTGNICRESFTVTVVVWMCSSRWWNWRWEVQFVFCPICLKYHCTVQHFPNWHDHQDHLGFLWCMWASPRQLNQNFQWQDLGNMCFKQEL